MECNHQRTVRQSSETWKDPDEMHHKSFPVFGLAGEDYLRRKGVLEH